MTWFHAARARLQLLAKGSAESRIDDEIRFHIEMETQKLVREQHLDEAEARRRALATFGGVQQHRETLRRGRGTAWMSGLSLDLKLGVRMLLKYPGLAIVGGLAMAFGIWFGTVTFQMVSTLSSTELPLPDGDRIVRIQNFDKKTGKDVDRVLYDYQLWRTARSITDLGAYRDASVNVVDANGAPQLLTAAEITASAFRIAPDRPIMGRVLLESDERPGAPPVVVIGHDVWVKRFNSDPSIVGRSVQLGKRFATVVGVMPEDYAFPRAHEAWLPLRTDAPGVEPGHGMVIKTFGRLASSATIEGAQAELTAIEKRIAAEFPASHAQIQSYVIPYAQMVANPSGDVDKVMALVYFFIFALVMVVCCTVALLMFARAASRESEIMVRSALGASRRRIVTQLFAEALVLAGVATAVGLAAAQFSLSRWGAPFLENNYGTLPFWYDFSLTPRAILYALGLAVAGAAVAGVMPARRITREIGTKLRAGTAGGGVSFGGMWTAVIVTQVALTVALPAVVQLVRHEIRRVESFDAGFPAAEYLAARINVDSAETATTSLEALRRRLELDPAVTGVTFVDQLPGEGHYYRRAEVVSLPDAKRRWVAAALIDPTYFDVVRAPVLSGRGFTSADLSPESRVVIVDRAFVDIVMGGRSPLGHRVRLAMSNAALDSAGADVPWYEIVGIAKDLGMASASSPQREAGVYLPSVAGSQGAVNLLVHTTGDPMSIAPRVRTLAMGVDPDLRIESMIPLDHITEDTLWQFRLWGRIILGLAGVTLLLSLAGIYAVLSYIVARRTREIGVRVALGASARVVIASIFRRPLIQVSLGVTAGIILIALGAYGLQHTTQFQVANPRGPNLEEIATLLAYAMLMLSVCAIACVVPTMRALRVQPTEALRAE